VLGCLFWWHADLGGLGVGKGKSAGSQKARRQWTQATYTHVSTNHRTVSHSSMVCSHCIAQTYACLLRSSFSGYRRSSFLLGRCALGLLCSHAPTERVPGLNACPWLPCRWGVGRKNQTGKTSRSAQYSSVTGTCVLWVCVCYRARHDSVWCMSVSIRWGSGPNNRLNLGCHQRRGAAALGCEGEGVTNESTGTKGTPTHNYDSPSLHTGRGTPAQSGQRAARMSNTRRFTKSHPRRASEDRRK
jgi:hypothetical protein